MSLVAYGNSSGEEDEISDEEEEQEPAKVTYVVRLMDTLNPVSLKRYCSCD